MQSHGKRPFGLNASLTVLLKTRSFPARSWGYWAAVPCLFLLNAAGQGISEPDLVMFGKVVNVTSNANLRLGYGTLNWVFQPLTGGSPVSVTTVLSNINNQFSYVLRIPCETPVFGYSQTANTIQLTPSGIVFNRAYVTWNNTNLLSFVQPALTNTVFFSSDRGRIEQVDLVVSAPLMIDPNNGLPVDWELTYFGRTGVDPFADPDHDGRNNFAEFRAGTDPNDPLSGLRFTEISPMSEGVRLKWLSADFKSYALQRSPSPTGRFVDIKTGIAGIAPTNTYLDATASNGGPYFYRLRIDDAFAAAVTNPLRLTGIRRDVPGGIRVEWLSSANHRYALQRSSNLSTGFLDIANGVVATPPVNSYLDASAGRGGPFFYRIRLEQ
jgi:hypothetical protein